MAKLGDNAIFIMGQAPASNDCNTKGIGTPFVKAGQFGISTPEINEWTTNPLKIATKDDVLVCVVGATSGKLNRGIDCAIGRSVAAIRPNTNVRRDYIYYGLHPWIMRLRNNSQGSAIGVITKDMLDAIEMPFPQVNEQDKIVKKLQTIEKIIAARKQELRLLDDLVKARFVELFGDSISNPKGWKKEKAEKHVDLLSGYPFQSEQYVETGVNICGGLIIMPQRIQWEECKHWPSTDGFADYMLAEGDIVMALDRPWISEGFKIAQIDKEHLPALLIQRTARIRGIDVVQEYLYYCFISGGFDKHSNVTGSLVPHISAKDIRSFEILLPPIELQEQFAAFVKQVDKSKVAVQKALDETQLLFDSLMQKYFG